MFPVNETYTYYRDGSMHTKTSGDVTTTYTYDGAGRLTNESSATSSISYAYDAANNRISMVNNGTLTTYTYDANNRMLTETEGSTTKTYTYDANGNQLTGDGATYTYNARGQQSGYSKGGVTASYTYLPTGLRKSKTVGITTTNFVWDGQNMVYEYNGTNSTGGTAYYYGLTLISQGNYAYYLYNAHGDVVQLVSSIGSLGLSYIYDAFGNEANPSAIDTNPFRYAGQYFDSETGTYYLRAQYYNPSVGRFTQQDGWQFADPNDPLSLNLYTYCYGNPVVFIDFSGNWPTWSQIGSAVFIVAIAAVSVTAIVVTAGAAGAAIGTGVAMYIGASASTAAAISTAATVGAYGVAAGVAAVGMSDAGEVLTGHNVIRDDLLGGNQAVYDDVRLLLGMAGNGLVTIGSACTPPTKPSSGTKRPLQTHHFASNKNSKFTKQFEQIVSKYDLDLDGDWNKAMMPHQGRHPNAYHQYVLDSMMKFDQVARGNTTIFLDLFESLKKTIMGNPEMLRKSYWEN